MSILAQQSPRPRSHRESPTTLLRRRVTRYATWARGVVFGALAYFVSPIDAIPDVTPGIGLTDDLGVLIGAIDVVATHITPEVKRQAADKLTEWFD